MKTNAVKTNAVKTNAVKTESLGQVNVDQIWTWLETVPDPEIPVISVVDLGIVRAISWHEGVLRVAITPTYSGCPANQAIADAIENCLREHGIENIALNTLLSPPWTTEWISEVGRQKLQAFGIAPPLTGGGGGSVSSRRNAINCPRCDSEDTEKISEFGSTPCKALYRCRSCLEPFDYFKCI